MELPCRAQGDELLRPGELTGLRRRLRRIARRHDLTTVIVYAFDRRTRMLPFICADMRMAPAGPRAIGAAMVDAGFPKTRIVLQQWNPNFRPSQMRLDGRVPDLFLLSSLQIHSAACKALIRDACRIDPRQRPLIIAGGPKTIYQPWDVFSPDPQDPWGADVAVTGEEYVLLSLLEVLLELRAGTEPLRMTFCRARASGLLDGIAGLVYARTDRRGAAEELVDTGIQRLVPDLDELPDPIPGYRLLEPPGRRPVLGSRPLAPGRIRRLSPLASLVLTAGCRFACPYCPIPAYSQHQYRHKSGQRIADEMGRLRREYGLRYFFGADDNFFDNRARALEIAETLARAQLNGRSLSSQIGWSTEVTVHDTWRIRDHLPLIHRAGVQALWLGVEDLTATLIRKGQSVDKTVEIFRLLRRSGIFPIPMVMHHDAQPFYTADSPYGLLNQVWLLQKAGAIDLQITMMTPAIGSRHYDEAFTSGLVYARVGRRPVEQRMFDGNHVVASAHEKPWRKQLNIIAAYLCFYNPLRFLAAIARTARTIGFLNAVALQVIWVGGMIQTLRRTFPWALRLLRGPIERARKVPASRIPMRSPDGEPASHAVPGTPVPGRAHVSSAAATSTETSGTKADLTTVTC